jgi:hypothetical protein
MDEIIDGRFERVENALAKLIHSISAYNPSPALATDLVTADAELSAGLDQCEESILLPEKAILIAHSINPPSKSRQDCLVTKYISRFRPANQRYLDASH